MSDHAAGLEVTWTKAFQGYGKDLQTSEAWPVNYKALLKKAFNVNFV
jgi:hypothetical protein